MTRTEPDEDELLSSGGLPAWVRWTAPIVVVAAVVLVVVKVLAVGNGAPTTAPTPTPSQAVISPQPFADTQPVQLPSGLPPGTSPNDVITDDDTTWVLVGNVLLRRTLSGDWRSHRILDDGITNLRMLFDVETDRLWIVAVGATHSLFQAVDAESLRPLGTVLWPQPVVAAAPVRGSLYVADRTGLTRIGVDHSTTTVLVPWARDVLDMVADPTRDRTLVLISAGQQTRIAVLGEVQPISTVAVPQPVTTGSFGITGTGDIWLAGFGRSGAVLERLDPGSLRQAAVSPLAKYLGPGAVLLAGGTGTLLVGSGSGMVTLWCIDGGSGTSLQQWQLLAEHAALASGVGFAIADDQLVRLHLAGRCTG